MSVNSMLPCVVNKLHSAFQEEVGIETDEEYGVTIPSKVVCASPDGEELLVDP